MSPLSSVPLLPQIAYHMGVSVSVTSRFFTALNAFTAGNPLLVTKYLGLVQEGVLGS